MALVRKTLRPIGQAAHLFFRSQIKLSLRGGLRLAFVEKHGSQAATPEAQAAAARRAELSAMLGELAQCLDADPDIRPELRHLAYLETILLQQGLLALDAVPLDVLRKALEQFEGLVCNWTPRGLATLRSKMAVAVSERGLNGAEGAEGAAAVEATPLPPTAA